LFNQVLDFRNAASLEIPAVVLKSSSYLDVNLGGTTMNEKDTDLNIEVVPWSATQETINANSLAVLQHPSIQKYLNRARYRVLSIQPIEPEDKTDNPVEPQLYRPFLIIL
jgi:hypothetical protein